MQCYWRGRERKVRDRLCDVNSWGVPDLKVAANITLHEIPAQIPAMIGYLLDHLRCIKKK